MKVYLAASFAYADKKVSDYRKAMITKAATMFRMARVEVFVPHEHTIPNAWGMPNNEWGAAVYGMDTTQIIDSDVVVMLSWGKANTNAGSLWEVGFAAGIGKKIVVVCMSDEVESMMVINSATAVLKGMSGLATYDWENMPVIRESNNEVS